MVTITCVTHNCGIPAVAVLPREAALPGHQERPPVPAQRCYRGSPASTAPSLRGHAPTQGSPPPRAHRGRYRSHFQPDFTTAWRQKPTLNLCTPADGHSAAAHYRPDTMHTHEVGTRPPCPECSFISPLLRAQTALFLKPPRRGSRSAPPAYLAGSTAQAGPSSPLPRS